MKKPVLGFCPAWFFCCRARPAHGSGGVTVKALLASGSCLHRDVAAIKKMHFCRYQTRAAATDKQARQNGAADRAAKSEGATQHLPRFAAPH